MSIQKISHYTWRFLRKNYLYKIRLEVRKLNISNTTLNTVGIDMLTQRMYLKTIYKIWQL